MALPEEQQSRERCRSPIHLRTVIEFADGIGQSRTVGRGTPSSRAIAQSFLPAAIRAASQRRTVPQTTCAFLSSLMRQPKPRCRQTWQQRKRYDCRARGRGEIGRPPALGAGARKSVRVRVPPARTDAKCVGRKAPQEPDIAHSL